MRQKIGFFTFRLPYPLVSGGQIRAFNLVRELAKHFDVHLFSFYKEEEELAYKDHLDFCAQIHTFYRRPLRGSNNIYQLLTQNPHSVWHMLKGYPFASALYFSPQHQREFAAIVRREQLEAIQFESFYPALYMDAPLETTTIFGTENVEYKVYEKFVNNLSFPFNQVLKIELERMRRYEESLYKKADFNLAVSKPEKKYIDAISRKDTLLVPNGVDVQHFSLSKKTDEIPTLLYIGNSKYFQNRDAIKKIITEIFPKINRKVRLVIVSDNITTEMREAAATNSDIRIESNLRDVREAFRRSDIILVPVYLAGGTRIKILEAFASQVAVVSTSIGVDGLEVSNGDHYREANTDQEFVNEVNYLLDHPKELAIMTGNAHRRVSEEYDWQTIATGLVELYHNLFLPSPNHPS